jgi:hypothetical protein
MSVAGRATADGKVLAHLSWRVATLRQSFFTPIFRATEHDLDSVAAAMAAFVVADSFALCLPTRDARAYPIVSQRISEPACVLAVIRDHPLGGRQTAQPGGGFGIVADSLPGRRCLRHREGDLPS